MTMRILLLAAMLLVAAPAASAAVVDLTLSCPSELKGDRPVFDLGASPTGPAVLENGTVAKPPPGFHTSTSLLVATADHVNLLAFSSGATGYVLDKRRCSATTQRLALGRHGLHTEGTYTRDQALNYGSRCVVSKVVLRARIQTDDLGVPVHAQVLVVRAKTLKPLMYVDWQPNTVHGFASPSCEKWPWLP
jgi:hypothetical protein